MASRHTHRDIRARVFSSVEDLISEGNKDVVVELWNFHDDDAKRPSQIAEISFGFTVHYIED